MDECARKHSPGTESFAKGWIPRSGIPEGLRMKTTIKHVCGKLAGTLSKEKMYLFIYLFFMHLFQWPVIFDTIRFMRRLQMFSWASQYLSVFWMLRRPGQYWKVNSMLLLCVIAGSTSGSLVATTYTSQNTNFFFPSAAQLWRNKYHQLINHNSY